jgi:hypothetical protein
VPPSLLAGQNIDRNIKLNKYWPVPIRFSLTLGFPPRADSVGVEHSTAGCYLLPPIEHAKAVMGALSWCLPTMVIAYEESVCSYGSV